VTDQQVPRPDGPFLPGRAVSEPSAEAITDAVRQVRAPWAASVAGILFAVLFTAAMVLLRSTPLGGRDDAGLAVLFARGDDWPIVVGGLYLGPFAGITFLWFVAVVRDQVGEREDRFFATVFLGSAILFVALLFVALAVATTPVVAVRFLDLRAPTADEARLTRSLAYTLLFAFATRAAAVLRFSTATLGLRTRAFPRWFALTGYVAGAILLLVVNFWDWVILLLPAWVAVISISILRRERAARQVSGAG
jgi:hypothetical protein